MAVKSPTVTRGAEGNLSVSKVSWNLLTGDTAVALERFTDFADKSVQIEGTFGAGTVTIEGSDDGTNFHVLRDPQGNALSFTSAGLKQVMETVLHLKPVLTGGTAADVTITMCLRSNLPRGGA